LPNFEVIAEVEDISIARVLVTALKAHGFNPPDGSETGLPGMPGVTGIKGTYSIIVPEDEAADARLLANSLIAEMQKSDPPQ